MLIENLVAGLRMFLTSQATNSKPSLTVVLTTIASFICITLAEIFIGLSVYKTLNTTYDYHESTALLITSAIYIIQAGLLLYYMISYYKKLSKENIIVREYNLLKNLLNSFIEGYKSRQ